MRLNSMNVNLAGFLTMILASPLLAQNTRVEVGKNSRPIPTGCISVIPAAIEPTVDIPALVKEAICKGSGDMLSDYTYVVDSVKREKDVLADKYRQQGKPENVIEKIVESGLKTYYKEVCLLEQAFIHDNAKSVAQAVKEAEGKIGAPVKITGFVRYALGEGIEKQESDFAAEVAAASGKK